MGSNRPEGTPACLTHKIQRQSSTSLSAVAAGSTNPALALLRGNNNPEIKFWETLNAVEELLNREADPDGERYALAKVLHTCQVGPLRFPATIDAAYPSCAGRYACAPNAWLALM